MKITKAIISVLLSLAMLGALSSCEIKDSDSDSTPTKTTSSKTVDGAMKGKSPLSDETEEEPTEPTSLEEETEAQPSSLDLYSAVLKNYENERITRALDFDVHLDKVDYEYAIKDINSDGIDELIICEKDEYIPEGLIRAVYTLDGDDPVELYFTERHGSYTIQSDGYFVFSYHEATIEKLVGTKLVFVAESDRLGDDYDAERDEFLRANGVSTTEMKFDYVPYNG